MAQLPLTIPVSIIAEWLPKIFPEGTPHRTCVVRQMSAKTLFVMFYIGAIEGSGSYLRPDQVTKMTDAQSARTADEVRAKWIVDSVAPGGMRDLHGRWYAANTREPIRDETLRNGLVALGAVIERAGLPTTSAKPRYAVARHFADLLVALTQQPSRANELIAGWQASHLTASALSRIKLIRRGTVESGSSERIKVTFPNGDTRSMHPGPSTVISKAVIEEFAPAFLREPGVILLSESGDKVVVQDDALAKALGLKLDYARNLPDVILADVCTNSPKIVFVEVVATDGPINEQRKQALLQVASAAGHVASHVYFISAFADRTAPAFRKLVAEIAWGTFVWFASEPDKLLGFKQGKAAELFSFLSQ